MSNAEPDALHTAILGGLNHWRDGAGVEAAGLADLLATGLRDSEAFVRRAAAEACGLAPDVGEAFADRLIALLAEDAEAFCREAAAFALGEIGGDSAVDALLDAARAETSPLVREAIAAALGAIGDPAGEHVVIGMTRGEKPAVRRRAVVACAAFDTAAADAAIRAALDDRDRYVREAAEWVLRPPTL